MSGDSQRTELAELRARIGILEDILAIQELKAAYSDAADGGWDRPTHDADMVASLFADSGVWDGGEFGSVQGKDNIRELFAAFTTYPFAFHRVTNPRVKIIGNRATGEWHLVNAVIMRDRHYMLGGVYKDEFVRSGGEWKFQVIRVVPAFSAKVQWRVADARPGA